MGCFGCLVGWWVGLGCSLEQGLRCRLRIFRFDGRKGLVRYKRSMEGVSLVRGENMASERHMSFFEGVRRGTGGRVYEFLHRGI